MNNKLETNLINNISPLNMDRAIKLLQEGRLKKTEGKKLDSKYILMASIEGKNRCEIFNSVIRIDLKTLDILSVACQCDSFKEGSRYKKNYFCEHLAALSQSFILNRKRKSMNSKNGDSSVNTTKVVKPKVIAKKFSKLRFNIDFYDNNEETYFIVNFVGLTLALNKLILEKIEFFKEEDKGIVSYLKEGKGYEIIKSNAIKIYPKDIRDFLRNIKDEKFKVRYDYKNYNLRVTNEDLPLEFILKIKDGVLHIKDKVNHPIALNNEGDAFIFEENIYLISEKQRKLYKDIYYNLRKKDGLKVNIEGNNSLYILEKINNLGARVNVDYYVASFLEKLIEREFYFYKKEDKIFIYPKVKLLNSSYSLTDIKEGQERLVSYIRSNYAVTSILNVNKFYSRDRDFVYYGDEEEYFQFLNGNIKDLKTYGKVFFKEENLIKKSEELKIDFTVEDYKKNSFYINLHGAHYDEFDNIYDAYINGEEYYKTEDEEYIDLKSPAFIEKMNFFKSLNIKSKKINFEVHEGKAFYISDYLSKSKDKIQGDELIKNAVEKSSIIDKSKMNIPKAFKDILRDYQKEGYYFFKTLSNLSLGGLLGDEMGLGKTVQAISFIATQRGKKTLVVAPTSLIFNWEQEFKNFSPNTKIKVIHGDKASREKAFKEIKKYNVIITSYGTLKNDLEKYKKLEFNFAFIDEAQNIKNHNTKVWEAVKEIKAKNKFALTGTPIENNLFELWSIFDFIMPGYLYSREEFKRNFINAGEEGLEALDTLIKPFILRRLKRDVLKELPPKIEKNIYIKMTEKQSRLYKDTVKEITLNAAGGEDTSNLLAYIMKLRQICLEPSLITKEESNFGGKIQVLLELINTEILNNNKVLIFSQFVSAFEKVKKELDKKNISYYYLDGKTKPSERVELVNEFNKDSDTNVFLISLKAGGTGLNLTSASTVIHLDPWWNASVEAQATDRAHRMGQKNVVTEIKLICKDSIEEEMVKLKESKMNLIEDVLNNDNLKLSNITKEELVALIK